MIGPEETSVDALREHQIEEGYVFPASTIAEEEPLGDGLVWRDIPMHPLPRMRSPTPFMPPFNPSLSLEEEDLEHTPDHVSADFDLEPTAPPAPPQPVISRVLHNWIVSHLTTDLVASEARVDECRWPQSMMPDAPFRATEGAPSQLRTLPYSNRRMVVRADAEAILWEP